MSGLEQQGDDGADDEDRFETFTQNDEERLKKRFPITGWTLGEVDDGRQLVGDRIARELGASDVVAFYCSLEVGEVPLHGGDESRFPGARRSLEWLERDVGVEGAIAGFGGL